jgi:superfamily II DNA or RNA helicase
MRQIELRDYQKVVVNNGLEVLNSRQDTLLVAPTGCHAPGTKILMYDGTLKLVEDIKVGDFLMGVDSTSRLVKNLYSGEDDMYEVKPLRGESFIVNSEHILSLTKVNKGSKKWSKPKGTIVNISIKDYLTKNKYFKYLYKLRKVGVNFKNQHKLPIDPYFLGLILGDGCLRNGKVNICTPDKEIVNYCYKIANEINVKITKRSNKNNKASEYFFGNGLGRVNYIKKILIWLGIYGKLSKEKFIPFIYKTASRKDRLSLLAGIMDTDGHLCKNCFEYCSASFELAQDVKFLARSLGFSVRKTNIKKAKNYPDNLYYRFIISGDTNNIPTKVKRKKASIRKQKKNPLVSGFSVEFVGRGKYYGFSLDKDNLYLTEDFIVHHNSGKTICISALIQQYLIENPTHKVLVIQHRVELISQNHDKFKWIAPNIKTSLISAEMKDISGQVVFCMVQTLSRNMEFLDEAVFNLIVIDEAHHCAATTYINICEKLKEVNPAVKFYGVTATPERGDKLSLRCVFNHIYQEIEVEYLISQGHLVPPRQFVTDIGLQEMMLSYAKSHKSGFESYEESIFKSHHVDYGKAYDSWKNLSYSRKTVAFTPTISASLHIMAEFKYRGAICEMVSHFDSSEERAEKLANFENGDTQILFNTMILTEGWDCPKTSCVLLFKSESYKSTYIQMVGRGLRPYPGKEDCIIIDFGVSSILHGRMQIDSEKALNPPTPGVAPTKGCPNCCAIIPLSTLTCPFCNFVFERPKTEKEIIEEFKLIELEYFKKLDNVKSKTKSEMVEIINDKLWLGLIDFNTFIFVTFISNKYKVYIGGGGISFQYSHDNLLDAFNGVKQIMNDSHHKITKRKKWTREPASDKQIDILKKWGYMPYEYTNFNRYEASCHLQYLFNKKSIDKL